MAVVEPSRVEMYKRNKGIGETVPKSVAVIGVGGVGSWVAMNLSLAGAKTIVLVDNDSVEEHNLNRTPFKLSQVDMLKVEAMSELILERRMGLIEVYPLCGLYEKLNGIERNMVKKCDVVVDCRDSSETLEGVTDKSIITGGYNGHAITMSINLKPEAIWGDTGGRASYTITPSWLVPPQLIANLITAYLCTNYKTDKTIVKNFNVKDILEWLY